MTVFSLGVPPVTSFLTYNVISDSTLTTNVGSDSFHTGNVTSMVSHLKPFNVASIHIANVSNMIRKMSTRSDSLLTGFSPVTSFLTAVECSDRFLTTNVWSDSFHTVNVYSIHLILALALVRLPTGAIDGH